jgi:glycosyltransferase involved in cell wall biosynthesis
MRIGIYYHAQTDRETGGDVVFQETIVDELSRVKTHHQICLFSPTVPANLAALPKEIRFIQLETGTPDMVRKVSEVSNRVTAAAFDVLFEREHTEAGLLEKAAREQRIDLIWFISNWTEKVTMPYIATVWDLAHRTHPCFPEVSVTGWKWKARERHYRELLPRATVIITGTTAGRDEIIRYYQVPEHLVQVVPFPTPPFALANSAPKEEPVGGEKVPENFLFYPAQFWPHKNHVGLLLALKILRETYGLDFNLVLSGADKGNLEHVMETARELGLAERVTCPGFVETGYLKRLYRQAFALVYPTFFGPDNLPPLEAFALGCPVIASQVSGAEEQLGSAALLFDPKHPEEIAQRVKELYDHPHLRDEMIRRGRERALGWTATDYVRRVLGIIDDFAPLRRCWSSSMPYIHP